jgi:D-alanyl-D-alanine carboxypeptidase/D-alanyl-D-alanine-endopeptidase (penicillin-binding protein 4)
MIIRKILYLCFALLFFSAPSLAQEDLTSPVTWQEKMRGRLDTLLMQPLLEKSQVAIMVQDLMTDEIVYAVNERQTMRPASTMKIITAVTALDLLGGNYRFTTRVGYEGEIKDSVLYGDLRIKGGFDPLFDGSDMHRIGQMLTDSGIKTIDGNIIIDQTMKDTLQYGEGWCWDDDNPVLHPFVYHHGLDSIWFPLPFSGTVVEQMQPVVRADDDTLVTVILGEVTHGMAKVLEPMMKKSNNYFAESVFYQIAASQSVGEPASALHAKKAVNRLINRIGLKSADYKVADGSGLSLYNYVSAELLTRVLRYAYRKPSVYKYFAPSLPMAGNDGTLEKRMRKTVAAGNVRAKTGTLTGIISLAGYCTAANGHPLAFAIINQGVLKGKDARDFQDKVCEVLCKE